MPLPNAVIYILELEMYKYYIGHSNLPISEYMDYMKEGRCDWTRKFRPVRIDDIYSCYDESTLLSEENKHTLKYMKRYGIDQVRGGSYSNDKLTEEQEQTLKQELDKLPECCQRCFTLGHHVSICPKNDYDTESEHESEHESERDSDGVNSLNSINYIEGSNPDGNTYSYSYSYTYYTYDDDDDGSNPPYPYNLLQFLSSSELSKLSKLLSNPSTLQSNNPDQS